MQIIWDTETYPNCFLLGIAHAYSDAEMIWECSEFQDDSADMFAFLRLCTEKGVEMVGFNSLGFDYPILHHLIRNVGRVDAAALSGEAGRTVARMAYEKAEMIIHAPRGDRFANQVWNNDRFIPQVDLFKVHHFDNVARTTSLKALQFAMRAESVEDLPISPGTILTREQIAALRHYCMHDVRETKRFKELSEAEIKFRRDMLGTLPDEVMNWSDVKIGEQMLIQAIGEGECYYREDGKRQPRQTYRGRIPVADIVFPYIRYQRRECQELLERFKSVVITNTRSAVSDSVELEGFRFDFGTGGVHGSRDKTAWVEDADQVIIDVDVTSLYPSIAIENGLYPEHLGDKFRVEYSKIRDKRAQTKKGTPENAAYKLALNGAYGKSNNAYSPFFDTQYTMATTINGQLLLLMLAERLLAVPSLKLIQVNTDGITYAVEPEHEGLARALCDAWSEGTKLQLERAQYRMFFCRDVNNYLAVSTEGKVKRKGAYDWPSPETPIGTAPSGPRAWHGDQSAMVVPMAAEACLVRGVPVEVFVRDHKDPFDFMCRAKTPGGSRLMHDGVPQQRITRYYHATNAPALIKESPPVDHAAPGDWKRKNGISDAEYHSIRATLKPGEWDARIHTANKSTYVDRTIRVAGSALVCNKAADFDWRRVDYEFYIAEASKLVDCFNAD